MTIAVMALQGAFAEHEQMLSRLGMDWFEVRCLADWRRAKDGLVLPGGESTVQSQLLARMGLLDAVRRDIRAGLPVLGTCAGLILLAARMDGQPAERLATMDMAVRRNAYGRQLGSFHATGPLAGREGVPMTFIRAPYIESVGPEAEVLATVNGRIVAARQGRQVATAFHPELDGCTLPYELAFLS